MPSCHGCMAAPSSVALEVACLPNIVLVLIALHIRRHNFHPKIAHTTRKSRSGKGASRCWEDFTMGPW